MHFFGELMQKCLSNFPLFFAYCDQRPTSDQSLKNTDDATCTRKKQTIDSVAPARNDLLESFKLVCLISSLVTSTKSVNNTENNNIGNNIILENALVKM